MYSVPNLSINLPRVGVNLISAAATIVRLQITWRSFLTVLIFICVLWILTSPTAVIASGNFLPLMRIKGISTNEDGHVKIYEIYRRSAGSGSTEFLGFSEVLNADDVRLSRNSELLPVRSKSFYEVLPFSWHVISDKPLSSVLPEFGDYSTTGEIGFVDLLRIFNIEVTVTPRHEFKYAHEATLIFEIRSLERAVLVHLPMRLDSIESSYFISNPIRAARELLIEFDRFTSVRGNSVQEKPWLKLIAFRGIEIADARNARALSESAQVYYELRFGSLTVDSGLRRFGAKDLSHDRFRFNQSLTY